MTSIGFEVLDSRGTATGRPDDVSSAPVDVVQLNDSSATTAPAVEQTSRNDFANSAMGVDVAALVGAAVAKTCAKR